MILRNARLGSTVVDIRIDDGVIVEVGPDLGPGDDLDGRWVSPGLWDHHVHFTQWALTSRRLDLSGATSAQHAADLVAAAPRSSRGIIGAGFRDGLWPDAPSREVLDRVTGDVPAVLVSGDLHSAWLNSAALELHGHRDHPSGLLSEHDAFEVVKGLATVPDETSDAWALTAAATAASRGVVGIVDFEMAWNPEVWQRRVAAGHDLLRVEFGVYTQHLDRAIAQGLRTGSRLGPLLSMGRFKVITDGSLNTRTAYLEEPYDDGTRGLLTVPPEELVPLMRTARDAGIQSSVHAIGDRANTLALDAFEAVGTGGSIEHAQLLSERDYRRFARLGVEASVQPDHAMDDRDVADRYWAGRTGRTYAFRSLVDAGATLRFGSDAPVSSLDPWIAMAAAVDRSRDGRAPWHPEQAVTNAEALAASTRTTVAVGQPADLVVTAADPLTARGELLRDMDVAATLLGGRYTFEAV